MSRIDRSKGKFRSFLLASLQNYLSNEADRARCLKRGGKAEFVYIDLEEAEDRYGLRRTVTLKVISEKYFGDAPARLRFLREARSAASVRHPNVASVYHLGKTGSSYFYARGVPS